MILRNKSRWKILKRWTEIRSNKAENLDSLTKISSYQSILIISSIIPYRNSMDNIYFPMCQSISSQSYYLAHFNVVIYCLYEYITQVIVPLYLLVLINKKVHFSRTLLVFSHHIYGLQFLEKKTQLSGMILCLTYSSNLGQLSMKLSKALYSYYKKYYFPLKDSKNHTIRILSLD